jgi:hypothetical protein
LKKVALLSYDGDVKRFRSVLSTEGIPSAAVAASSCGCADTLLSLSDFLNNVRAASVDAPDSLKKRIHKKPLKGWLRRLGYAIAAAAGALIGASAEELGTIALTIF